MKRELKQIPVGAMKPNPQQPRADFDEAALAELAQSLRQDGQLQPVEAEDNGDGTYTLIFGERRWRAAQLAQLETIDALVSPPLTAAERRRRALIENVHRADMKPVELAQAYQDMADAGMSRQEIAAVVGKAMETVTTYMRLLELPAAVREKVNAGEFPVNRQATMAILSIADEDDRERLGVRLASRQQTIQGVVSAVDAYHALKNKPVQKRAERCRPHSGDANLTRVVWEGRQRPDLPVYDLADAACRGCVFGNEAPTLACDECRLVAFVREYRRAYGNA